MRPFQESTRDRLDRIASEHGIRLAFETVRVEPNPAIGHESGDVFLRTTFSVAGRSFDLYLYTNEAEANVDSHYLAFELPDFDHDEIRLQEAYVWFLNRAFAGADVIETYWKSRKQGAALTSA